jgi:hypothetical protein
MVRVHSLARQHRCGRLERRSRQPEREHLDYWAHGLSLVYVEGALDRAMRPIAVRVRVEDTPATDAPAPRVVTEGRPVVGPEPVLDPSRLAAATSTCWRRSSAPSTGRGCAISSPPSI